MKLMKTGLVVVLSVMLTACGGIAGYMDTSDKKLEGKGVTLSEKIQTKDLYGTWAFATEDDDPNDVTLIFALFTDHTGVAYATDTNRKTKIETVNAELFTWQFNEGKKELYSNIIKESHSVAGKRTEKTLNKLETHKVDLYRLDNEKFAIKLVSKDQRLIFLRMPNSTYNKFIQGRPELPKLK